MTDFTQQIEAVKRAQRGVGGFAADMREKGIHVGMGRDPRCVNCGEVWPCAGSKEQ